jgi:hypothetical protein
MSSETACQKCDKYRKKKYVLCPCCGRKFNVREEVEKLVWKKFEEFWGLTNTSKQQPSLERKYYFHRMVQGKEGWQVVPMPATVPNISVDDITIDTTDVTVDILKDSISPQAHNSLGATSVTRKTASPIQYDDTCLNKFFHDYLTIKESVANEVLSITANLVFIMFPMGKFGDYLHIQEPKCFLASDIEEEHPWLRFIPNWTQALPTINHNVVD